MTMHDAHADDAPPPERARGGAPSHREMAADACDNCPALTDRRAFLRHAGLSALAALAAAGLSPGGALAETVRAIAPLGGAGMERSYPIPSGDAISVDAGNDVILARWQNHVYAFSLRCPHRGTRLEWRAGEGRFFCPKHKARFRPDGAHDSGRRTRSLDRYAVRREGAQLVVDLSARLREDADAARWSAAVVALA